MSVTLRDQDWASAKFPQELVGKTKQYVRPIRKRMLLEICVLLQALVVIAAVQIESFLFSSLLPMPVFASVFLRNTVLSVLHCRRSLTFCLLCNYPLLNTHVAWTEKFIKYMVSLSFSEPLSSGIFYYKQKDCAGKIYSAKKVYSSCSLVDGHNWRRIESLKLAIYVC